MGYSFTNSEKIFVLYGTFKNQKCLAKNNTDSEHVLKWKIYWRFVQRANVWINSIISLSNKVLLI